MMTYEEAAGILQQTDPTKRMIDDDGRMWKALRVKRRADEVAKIVQGEMEAKDAVLLTVKEAEQLEKAVKANPKRPTGMTPSAAARAIQERTTPSGKIIFDDPEGQKAHDILTRQAEALFFATDANEAAKSGPAIFLSKAELKAIQKIEKNTESMIANFEKSQKKATQKSLWGKLTALFKGQPAAVVPKAEPIKRETSRPFDWKDSRLWHEVQFRTNGQVFFSYRINVSKLTPEQEAEVRKGLDQMNINYTVRSATFDGTGVRAGDKTIRLADEKSIDTFRMMVLNHAMQPGWSPSAMSLEKYEEIQKRIQTADMHPKSLKEQLQEGPKALEKAMAANKPLPRKPLNDGR